MKIDVTQKHIDDGVKRKCKKCPVALALHDAGFPNAAVGPIFFTLEEETSTSSYLRLPGEVSKFVCSFDGGEPVQPISFELDLNAERI